jgi:hypothetical protein
MKRLGRLRSGCCLFLLAMLALPATGWASAGSPPAAASCNPFCGVLRFMAPQSRSVAQHAHHAATERRVYAARTRTIRVAHAAPVHVYYPHQAYAAASPPPPPYPRIVYPRYRTWQAVYPVYAYRGYGYVYYYVYPYGYRAY